ncbi:MAG: OFA family MFS transporter [Clostridiales bacterium]|nr:OFA family MFS transporter [Clostridiales bacterium]
MSVSQAEAATPTPVLVAPTYVLSRWTIPVAGLLLTLMGGIAYAWGVFIVPLETQFGWVRAQAALPVSIYLAVFSISMIVGGILQDRHGPRKVAATGGALFLVGYLLASQVGAVASPWWLVFTYGVIGGFGCGLAYCVAVPTIRKWFPDRPGFPITLGLVGFGIASVIFAPWITRLIGTVGIENTFLLLGIVTSTVTFFAAWLMRLPAPDWTPTTTQSNASKVNGGVNILASRSETTLKDALRTPLFYLLWLGFAAIIFGGLMAMTHVTPYGKLIGLEPADAALAMVFFGLANGFGRPIAGLVAERFGPVNVMLVTYVVTAATYLAFNTVATNAVTLYACAFVLGIGFAVTLGLFPVLATVSFGAKNLGAVYGGIFTAFGVSAFFGPMTGALLYDRAGTYIVPFAVAGTFTIVGWLLCLVAFKLKYRLP